MEKESTFKLIGGLLLDELRAILYFPVWWYSRGLLDLFGLGEKWFFECEMALGLNFYARNFLTPVFGQSNAVAMLTYLWRFLVLIVKSIILLFFFCLLMILAIIWIIAPIFVIYQIILHI
jgi:hypothetical protein